MGTSLPFVCPQGVACLLDALQLARTGKDTQATEVNRRVLRCTQSLRAVVLASCFQRGSSAWDRRPRAVGCQSACSRGRPRNTLTWVWLSLHTLHFHQDVCSSGVTRARCANEVHAPSLRPRTLPQGSLQSSQQGGC